MFIFPRQIFSELIRPANSNNCIKIFVAYMVSAL